MSFVHLEICADLSAADLEKALGSRDLCAALLRRMSTISAPNTGVPAVVSVFAALASMACDWIDGDLAIELEERDDRTNVMVMTELGAGMRERLFQPFVLAAPLAEIATAIEQSPALVGCLVVRRVSWKRLHLVAAAEVRKSTMPPRIGISDASMWLVGAREPGDET